MIQVSLLVDSGHLRVSSGSQPQLGSLFDSSVGLKTIDRLELLLFLILYNGFVFLEQHYCYTDVSKNRHF